MTSAPAEHHYAYAARRHYEDAVYLHDDGRIPNADHHFGFAVECALKSLLLRHLGATMNPKKGGRPSPKPWVPTSDGKARDFGHLPWIWDDVALMLHGRSGSALAGLLSGSSPFEAWSVDDRYLDGTAVVETAVAERRTSADQILRLHQQALLTGVLQ
ncbi:hypothetical protein [Streptomyces daliensis]|uniref:HEPN domain-containing protein n=1 Tax=Streptomyces daliensis TaxID=299421 RepID=A0A8T4IU21_9ACTN|nr:hypothetical protein [Streptomyces daliensis]